MSFFEYVHKINPEEYRNGERSDRMMLSELKRRVDDAIREYGDIPVIEENDYWGCVNSPRSDSLVVGISEEAPDYSIYKDTPCFLILVGC